MAIQQGHRLAGGVAACLSGALSRHEGAAGVVLGVAGGSSAMRLTGDCPRIGGDVKISASGEIVSSETGKASLDPRSPIPLSQLPR